MWTWCDSVSWFALPRSLTKFVKPEKVTEKVVGPESAAVAASQRCVRGKKTKQASEGVVAPKKRMRKWNQRDSEVL